MIFIYSCVQNSSAYLLNQRDIKIPFGYELIWHDEFDEPGTPSEENWSFENGFVRNKELQWYQPQNAEVQNGLLLIHGIRETVENIHFDSSSNNWQQNRETAEYTSACLHSKGKQEFQYGIIEVRAKIDTAMGMWPAIWTLGVDMYWPKSGEVDIMEFYRVNNESTILANAAWEKQVWDAKWDSHREPLKNFLKRDPKWVDKFHVWKMDWETDYIRLYLDDQLMNEIDLTKTLNKDGYNPFHQPHYILLNLAIGANGGDPSQTVFPKVYEVDYVRVFQKKDSSVARANPIN